MSTIIYTMTIEKFECDIEAVKMSKDTFEAFK